MATNNQNFVYDGIDRPYSNELTRSESDMSVEATGVDPLAGGRTILSGQALTDAWIDTFIKSTNYSPKKMGFLIDGLKGYIECMSIYISGSIVGGSLDIPDQTSVNSFHVDINGNAWWGSPTAGGFALGKASIQANGIATFGLATGARIVLNQSNAYFYNDIGSPETSATINFVRTDANPGTFKINKRKSTINSLGNVMEMFYDDIPAGGVRNYMFLGRIGTATSVSDYDCHVSTLGAKELVQVNTSAVNAHPGWAVQPNTEIAIITSDYNVGPFVPFNSGGSRVVISAVDTTVSAPYNWSTGGGGAAIAFGFGLPSGAAYGLLMDLVANWQLSDMLPGQTTLGVTVPINIGSSTRVFASCHSSSFQTRYTDNTLYGTIDTSSGYWNFASSGSRNFRLYAGSGTVFVEAASIAPMFSGGASCGLNSQFWSNVYTNNVTLSGSYINYVSSAIQLNSDTKIIGTLRATGSLECTTARIRVGTTDFYVTADPDAPGKFYLRS